MSGTANDRAAHDPAVLADLRALGGDELVRELIVLFLSYAPERLAAARSELAAGDASTVRTVLHSLKSSAGQLGALALRDACSRGEDVAGRTQADAAQALATVEALWPATRDWLIAQRG